MCPIKTIAEARLIWKKVEARYQDVAERLAYDDKMRAEVERFNKKFREKLDNKQAETYEEAIKAKFKDGPPKSMRSPSLIPLSKQDPNKAIRHASITVQSQLPYRYFTKYSIRTPAHPIKHGASVAFLIGNEKVNMQLSLSKQQQLLQALNRPNSKAYHNMFEASDKVAETALGLYRRQKITVHQIFTLLRRIEILHNFKLKERHRIVDDNGKLTEKGRWLINAIDATNLYKPFDSERLNAFKCLIASLPLSEQYFDITVMDHSSKKGLMETLIINGDILTFPPRDSDLSMLFKLRGIKQEELIIELSTAAIDALFIVQVGLDQLAIAIPRMGRIDAQLIKDGLTLRMRPCGIHFPAAKLPYNPLKRIHHYPILYQREQGDHDLHYHTRNLTFTPVAITEIFVLLRDRIKSFLKTNSYELWKYSDFDFIYSWTHFNEIEIFAKTTKQTTQLFCNTLLEGNGTTFPLTVCMGGYLLKTTLAQLTREEVEQNTHPSKWKLELFGVIFFVDLIKNPNIWLAKNIDPKFFIEPFRFYFLEIQKIYLYIKDDIPAMQFLKYQLYKLLESKNSLDELEDVYKYVHSGKDTVENKLQVKKILKSDPLLSEQHPLYSLYVAYQGEQLNAFVTTALIRQYSLRHCKRQTTTIHSLADSQKENKKAIELYRAEKYDQAIEKFESIVKYLKTLNDTKSHIQLRNSLFNLGSSLFLNKNYDQALQNLEAALLQHKELLKKDLVEQDPKYEKRLNECIELGKAHNKLSHLG